jgi:hypothetical protein
MWPIREFESGIPRAEIAQRARRGRTQMHTGRSVQRGLTTTTGIMRQFDSSGARPAQRLVRRHSRWI